jgi:hypothetical protein
MQKDVAILSTVINDELYIKSSQLFPKDIQTYVINGKNGMHGIFSLCYMMKKLKGKGIKWLIMADEDVLFVNPDGINAIINKMKTEHYMVSGVRDGAVIPIRSYNPYVINTFFSIVNFEALEKIWNKKEMLQNQYIEPNEFNDDLSNCTEKFDAVALFEQYYCFYLWLRRKNQKILFLDATNPFSNDSISTLVKGINGEILLYHTWYARSYGVNEKHTKRIDYIFSLIKFEKKAVIQPIIFNERTFYWKQKIKKFKQKILMKIQ